MAVVNFTSYPISPLPHPRFRGGEMAFEWDSRCVFRYFINGLLKNGDGIFLITSTGEILSTYTKDKIFAERQIPRGNPSRCATKRIDKIGADEKRERLPDRRTSEIESSERVRVSQRRTTTYRNVTPRLLFVPGLFETDGLLVHGTMCDHEFYSSQSTPQYGRFYSPRYPSSYPRNIRCSYLFRAR